MSDPRSSFPETAAITDPEEMRLAAGWWRRLFALTVAVVIMALWGAWFESTAYEKRVALAATAVRQSNLAVAAEQFSARVLRNAETVARFLGRAWLTAPSREAFAGTVNDRARNNDALSEITVCFDDGSFLTSSEVDARRDTWCRTWLADRSSLDPGSFIAPQVVRGDDVLVPVAMRLADREGHTGGIVVSLVSVRRVLGLLQDFKLPEVTVVLLASAAGQVLARWHSETGTSDQRAPEAPLVAGANGEAPASASLREVGGRRVVYTTRPVPGYPLNVAVATDETDVLADSQLRAVAYGVACALVSTLLGLLALLLWRQYGRTGRMAESLGRARERLQMLNADLEHKVEQRTRELEHAYRDLESFSYTVAHDVRAPIAAIRGFADVMAPALEAKEDARLAHYLRRINANAVQMSELTESLLALGKLARAPVQLVRVDLSAMAQQVLQGLREAATEPRVADVHVQPGIAVMADRVLVRQVLENLLGNAWKFTSQRKEASIRMEATRGEGGWLTVSIADNGAGFDGEGATHLFEPFRRMHAAAEFPGTGVGLATVQRIVRLHGGRVWLKSKVGEGTTAFFTLQESP